MLKTRPHINIYSYSTKCCEQEIMNLHIYTREDPDICFDFVEYPQLADVVIISGPVNEKAGKKILEIYDCAPKDVFVIACGACAISGGVYNQSYNIKKIEDIIPVQLFISGCPPSPSDFICALKTYLKIKCHIKKAPQEAT